MMTEVLILKNFKERKINLEEAFNCLVENGISPALLNDDNGHWAVTFDGIQDVPSSFEPENITLISFVQKNAWKDTIYEAFIWAMKENLEDEC